MRMSFHILRTAERLNGRIRGIIFRMRVSTVGGTAGKQIAVGPGVKLIVARGARLHIGDRVAIGIGAVISVGERASLVVGEDAYIGHYTLIGAERSLTIGDRAQIAEHCSLRDHDHDTTAASMRTAAVVCAPTCIGMDAWVGRGVAVLRGAQIGEGTVIGANAVVRGPIPGHTVAAGVPARVIRTRRPGA